jgi:hypothetical protein
MRLHARRLRQTAVRVILSLLAISVLSFADTRVGEAQTPQGATLTILGGQIGVLRTDGSALQPAPSGITLGVGSQVATIGQSEAIVTFFEGTELELGWNTTIILKEIVSQGQEVHVTVEDVFGSTVSRIKGFVSPNSSYKIQNPNGQVVALVRGSVAKMNVSLEGTGVNCQGDCAILVGGSEVCNSKTDKDCSVFEKDGGDNDQDEQKDNKEKDTDGGTAAG